MPKHLRIRTGAVSSGYDPRNHVFQNTSFTPAPGANIRLQGPHAIKDQGWPASRKTPLVPCCVSCSVTTAVEFLGIVGWDKDPLSPLFHYYIARSGKPALVQLDALSALQILLESGTCRESLHSVPMNVEGARQPSNQAAINDAVGLSIAMKANDIEYARIRPSRIPSLQAWLSDGYPIIVFFSLTDTYLNLSSANPVHGAPTPAISYDLHAVLLIGYEEINQRFIVQDSRGAGFAEGGCWYLPYDLLDPSTSLVSEAWGLRRIPDNL